MNKNQFAQTPPMGWNSYDYYDTSVTEAEVKANADYMATHLKQYGWEYIVVDIQWYAKGAGSMRDRYQYIPFSELEMDAYGRLLPDPDRFPSSVDGAGFGPLADYVHSLGLKFGIHIMRGIPRAAAQAHLPVYGTDVTAADVADPFSISRWNPDMYGLRNEKTSQAYYDSVFSLYAQWGVDYVKCDDICNTNAYPLNPYSAEHEVEMLQAAIQKCGRPIVLSLSPGPALIEKAWHYEKYANMWRITDDFWDDWALLLNMFARCELWQNHVKPGCFPDCDMLPLGTLGKGFGQEWQCRFTRPEQITMMTLWCMFRSPLMLGAEMTKLDDWTLSLLTNREVLALLQDGHHGVQIQRTADYAVWGNYSDAGVENQEKSGLYVALFNLKDEEAEVSVSVDELADAFPTEAAAVLYQRAGANGGLKLQELWSGETEAQDGMCISAMAEAHGAKLFRIL
ncbi:MAG: glycoside hydrolase family 27 protein [Lachnospiraceae bacterium]|nr:glycoside hydrolase family 27 protein [Lachnospiraceae bacterium]